MSAEVHADKPDDEHVRVRILSHDPSLGSNVQIGFASGDPGSADVHQLGLRVQVQCALSDAQLAQLDAALSGPAMTDVLASSAGGTGSDADTVAAAIAVLAAAGFTGVTVALTDGALAVTVNAPPAS